jgi:hypothetical protein
LVLLLLVAYCVEVEADVVCEASHHIGASAADVMTRVAAAPEAAE